jgi:hypothetical protein
MAETLNEQDEDIKKPPEDLVIVEDKPQRDDADEDDDRIKADEDSGTDSEREAIRERRRLEKIERRDRKEKAITRDKTELDFLRKRNDELERRMGAQEQRAHQTDLQNIDAHIRRAQEEAELSDRVIAKAVESSNGADVAQALKYRDQALAKINQLQALKAQAAQIPAKPQQGIDDMTMQHAREFMSENPWYDSNGRDEDSAIVIAIDQSLSKDGYDPKSEEYWSELKRRAARRLPERFKTETRVARGGPAVGSGREHAPTSTRNEVYISPERKQALIEAGVWDDPILRKKYAARYQEYDRNNRNQA